MTLQNTTIMPGRIVVLRTSVTGNVKYSKTIIQPETATDDGGEEAKWETERRVQNAAEQKEASAIRSQMRFMIATLCSQTSFGLLLPEAKFEQLKEATDKARAKADEFNERATVTRINFAVVAGRVAADDVEAVRAINAEVRELMQQMESGLAELDVKKVREAADKAKNLGSMLTPEMGERVEEAIKVARTAATAMRKAAEVGAAEIDLQSIRKITEARTQFLDISDATEVAAPMHEGAALDLMPIEAAPADAVEQAAPQIESFEGTEIAPVAGESMPALEIE
jgi:hypothetical protein